MEVAATEGPGVQVAAGAEDHLIVEVLDEGETLRLAAAALESTCTSSPPSSRQAAAAACSNPLPLTFTCTIPIMDASGGFAEVGEVRTGPCLPQLVLGDQQS